MDLASLGPSPASPTHLVVVARRWPIISSSYDSCSVIPPPGISSSSSVPPSETLWPSPGPWTPPFNYTWVPLFHPNETSWIRNDQIILVGVLQYKDKYACNIALAQKDEFTQSVIANIAEILW